MTKLVAAYKQVLYSKEQTSLLLLKANTRIEEGSIVRFCIGMSTLAFFDNFTNLWASLTPIPGKPGQVPKPITGPGSAANFEVCRNSVCVFV